jgi:hypothetical protein
MLLTIDIGNTNTSLGVFDGANLVAHWRLTTERARTGDEWGVLTRNLFALSNLDFKSIDAIAIASVVPPLNFTIHRMAEIYFQITPPIPDWRFFISRLRMWGLIESSMPWRQSISTVRRASSLTLGRRLRSTRST